MMNSLSGGYEYDDQNELDKEHATDPGSLR